VLPGAPTFAEVESELNAGRPLAARFRWGLHPDQAHFVALVGCGHNAALDRMIEIQDP